MHVPFLSSLGLSLSLLAAALPAAAADINPGPDPRLSPRQIVQLQLDALKTVDQPRPDAGFATVFRFASPQNQTQTGPLPRFSKMIREGFGEMLNHRSATLLPLVQKDDQALQPVELLSLGGQTYRYVFVLRRQDAPGCKACWFTDGVVPQEAGERSLEL